MELKIACNFLRKLTPSCTALSFVVLQIFRLHSIIHTAMAIYRVFATHGDFEELRSAVDDSKSMLVVCPGDVRNGNV